jgi:hypothetical protein
MKSARRLLWAAPLALVLVLAQCNSSTAPRIPEQDPEPTDSVPKTAYRISMFISH